MSPYYRGAFRGDPGALATLEAMGYGVDPRTEEAAADVLAGMNYQRKIAELRGEEPPEDEEI